MINSVRNTVLAILNKNNYGYISPSDFNLFAKQAQLDLFQDYFFQYNYQISKENVRQSGTGYANLSGQFGELIERFIVSPTNLTHISDNIFSVPTEPTTGSSYFSILNILCYDTTTTPKTYKAEAEKINSNMIPSLLSSNIQKPSGIFPIYTIQNDRLIVYPNKYSATGAIECSYIRYPKDPKWTYDTIVGGTPVFNPTKSDYQDFELDKDDEVSLVMKICQYAGMSIRESEVYQFAKSEEMQQSQSEQ
jgi:hypothetical protein